MAYKRKKGFGIRNYVLVISTVHCANTVAQQIAAATDAHVITHDVGCGEGKTRQPQTFQCLLNAGKAPNIFAVLIVGLGCEQVNGRELKRLIEEEGKQVEFLSIQEEGGPQQTKEKGVAIVKQMMAEAAKQERVPCPMEELSIGIQCGGSDWTTALTGNVTLGEAVDRLVSQGAAVMMSEVGGLPGSEHLLAQQAASYEVGLQIIDVCDANRARYLARNGHTIEETNPTPGNKEGGITTLVEKSTGNIKKAGHNPLQGVLELYQRPPHGGLWIIDHKCPGLESVTINAFALAGAHMMLFTTGRGTPVGSALLPLLRLTGNPESFRALPSMLDFNAGVVIEGTPLEKAGEDLYNMALEVAEGKRLTKTEINGNREFFMMHPEES